MRMREVIACVDRIGVEAAQVLGVQLEQRASEIGSVTEIHGELVGLELVLARDHVHTELDNHVEGGERVVEEEEADDDGALGVELEGGVEGAVVDEDGEEGEDVEEMGLGNGRSAYMVDG